MDYDIDMFLEAVSPRARASDSSVRYIRHVSANAMLLIVLSGAECRTARLGPAIPRTFIIADGVGLSCHGYSVNKV